MDTIKKDCTRTAVEACKTGHRSFGIPVTENTPCGFIFSALQIVGRNGPKVGQKHTCFGLFTLFVSFYEISWEMLIFPDDLGK